MNVSPARGLDRDAALRVDASTIRIELVVPALPAAGMEVVVASLARGLAGRGHDVGVTCLHFLGTVGEALQRDVPVRVVPTPGLRTIVQPTALAEWLKERSPDVVHVHSGAWLKTARAASLAGTRAVVCTLHGFNGKRPWYEAPLERWAARRTSASVAVSPALTPYIVDRLRVPRARSHVIPNGIDTGKFQPGHAKGALRESLGLGPDDVIIGHVARFAPVKNHSMLVDAFALAVRSQPRGFLALVGDGPLRGEIEARVDELGIRSRVAFLGSIDDMPELYRELDVLVLPSHSEAASMSILEGMASGLPIVATAVGGTPELLDSGRCGILVRPGDADELSRALVRIILESETRAHLGSAARKRAVETFSIERMLDGYESLYRQLLATAPE